MEEPSCQRYFYRFFLYFSDSSTAYLQSYSFSVRHDQDAWLPLHSSFTAGLVVGAGNGARTGVKETEKVPTNISQTDGETLSSVFWQEALARKTRQSQAIVVIRSCG